MLCKSRIIIKNSSAVICIDYRIEFTDTNALYTSLYEFDAHMEAQEKDGHYEVTAFGELKDRNRWEGGVAYTLTHKIYDDYVEKNVKLRFHGQKPLVKIIEPIIENENTKFVKMDDKHININGGSREFTFELLSDGYEMELGTEDERYAQDQDPGRFRLQNRIGA